MIKFDVQFKCLKSGRAILQRTVSHGNGFDFTPQTFAQLNIDFLCVETV